MVETWRFLVFNDGKSCPTFRIIYLFSMFRNCGHVSILLEVAFDLWKAFFTGTDYIRPAIDH